MNLKIIERMPTAQEFNNLRQAVGWRIHALEVVEKGLSGSLYGVCAYIDAQIVGMARIIGDGGLVFYIQDVIVKPEFQGQGIGRAMMDMIMEYIRLHASQNSVVGLMSAVGKEQFYEHYGFTRRPNDKMGCGMTIFWPGNAPTRLYQR